MANTKIFKQYDSRWASLPYPTKSSPVSTDGCGLCAVTHCAIEVKGNENLTPKDVLPFMKQYAVAGNGTRYANPDGIAEGLKHFGLKDVRVIGNMSDFWEELDKGDRVGIILFDKGYAPDGTLWTSARHFIAFNQYQYVDGKHKMFMKDSGGRDHDGFYSYETSMRGCLYLMWTGRVPKDGWRKEGKYWYFYKNDKAVVNGWAKDSKGKWFYLGDKGRMVTSRWVYWKNEWYYLGSSGEMLANGWAKDSKGKWFYCGSDGKMVKSKWVKWKNIWYYLDDDGEMATNTWRQDKTKKWFYLDSNGKMMTSAWIKYKDQWYYVGADGAMVTGKQTINGKTYEFDQYGNFIG